MKGRISYQKVPSAYFIGFKFNPTQQVGIPDKKRLKVSLELLLITFLISILSGCILKNKELQEIQEYTGPVIELGSAITFYSDSAMVKMRMEAPKQLEFGNGDREFPEGLYLEFYDKEGNLSSTLRANYCYYTSKEDLYKATGNVVIIDAKTNDRLDTEELLWSEKKEEVFTDKFVRIERDGELQMGDGLEAKQDFSYWKILNYKGTMTLND